MHFLYNLVKHFVCFVLEKCSINKINLLSVASQPGSAVSQAMIVEQLEERHFSKRHGCSHKTPNTVCWTPGDIYGPVTPLCVSVSAPSLHKVKHCALSSWNVFTLKHKDCFLHVVSTHYTKIRKGHFHCAGSDHSITAACCDYSISQQVIYWWMCWIVCGCFCIFLHSPRFLELLSCVAPLYYVWLSYDYVDLLHRLTTPAGT